MFNAILMTLMAMTCDHYASTLVFGIESGEVTVRDSTGALLEGEICPSGDDFAYVLGSGVDDGLIEDGALLLWPTSGSPKAACVDANGAQWTQQCSAGQSATQCCNAAGGDPIHTIHAKASPCAICPGGSGCCE